jgi:hypothetical protein
MTDRSDEQQGAQIPTRSGHGTDRVAVIAKLRPDSSEQARAILTEGAPYDLGESGFRRHSAFLATETVVFVFEGPGVERLVRDLLGDPARSAAFSVWGPLLDGTPALAREEFYWEASPSS